MSARPPASVLLDTPGALLSRSHLRDLDVDSLTGDDVAQLVMSLSAAGKKRETIRKSVKYLAAVLDYAGVEPNPARDKQRVRLPYEELEEMNPPTAAHVDAVCRLLAPAYRLPLLWLDWSGARVASVDTLRVGDYDERDRRIRLRASTTKSRQALWVELPDVLAHALEASQPSGRETRNSVSNTKNSTSSATAITTPRRT